MWNKDQPFVNDEHHRIFEATEHIPGWQVRGDSNRLYEMGYKAGDVILEIGMFGGRSATVELKGALANPNRQRPLYFGIDVDFTSIWRSLRTLSEQHLHQHSLAFHGDLEKFIQRIKIQPTMVFVDGDHRYDGVIKDLELLSGYLIPEVPVLCHDYSHEKNATGEMGVRQAVDEFVADGWARMIGKSGCSALLVTTEQCQGSKMQPWSTEQFAEMKAELLWEYTSALHQELHRLRNQISQPVAA